MLLNVELGGKMHNLLLMVVQADFSTALVICFCKEKK